MAIGFSTLGGRPDLFDLAGELKSKGAITILAGPQANVDYKGEKDRHHHRLVAAYLSGVTLDVLITVIPVFIVIFIDLFGILLENEPGSIVVFGKELQLKLFSILTPLLSDDVLKLSHDFKKDFYGKKAKGT